MIGTQQLLHLFQNLRDLGARRLIALGFIGLAVVGSIAAGAYFLGQPEREPLYANLSRDDVGRVGAALKDAGIMFDVSSDGATVLVAHSDTAKARMLLAVKGLPQSGSSGYELFNDVRSFGLTSFMQEITRVRALEGELARTIQSMKGIRAARVHIVLPDRASFRHDQQRASASVVIRTENADDASGANAIRHLVAAAVPGLKLEEVTVLNTEGAVLTSSDDSSNAVSGKKVALQQQLARETEEKIRRTLTPYLGIGNFEVSVSAQLDTDKVTSSETTYDPASKVERSVRVVKETENSQNRSKQPAASVAQSIPSAKSGTESGTDSAENTSRREELTNFEVSTRTVQTVRDAYTVRSMSIAVLVNKERLAPGKDGKDGKDAKDGKDTASIEQQIYEVEQLVASAAGVSKERGDKVKVSAVAFADAGHALEPIPPLPWTELLLRQAGTMINAVTILIVASLLIWFGLRPAIRSILERRASGDHEPIDDIETAMLGDHAVPAIAGPHAEAVRPAQPMTSAEAALAGAPVNLIEDVAARANRSPQKRLEQIVTFDEEQAATILRQWLRQEANA